MLQNGEYVAWFRTPRGSGTGRVRFRDGELAGSDSIIGYLSIVSGSPAAFTRPVGGQ
jgi:hypothetical protein